MKSIYSFLPPIDLWSFDYCFFRFAIKDNNKKKKKKIDCDWQQVIGLLNVENEEWNLTLDFIFIIFCKVNKYFGISLF